MLTVIWEDNFQVGSPDEKNIFIQLFSPLLEVFSLFHNLAFPGLVIIKPNARQIIAHEKSETAGCIGSSRT